MKNFVVEVCCETLDEVHLVSECNAQRIEFTSALETGGVTPSLAALRLTLKRARQVNIKSAVMLRPRSGDFCASDSDFETMTEDARILCDEGSDYIVFGILNKDGVIDYERCKTLVEICGKTPCVFHRAFDKTPDWKSALDTLVSLKFKRILTSGHSNSAEDGISVIKEMMSYANERIEILPGGGIRANNVRKIIENTGVNQVHFSLKKTANTLLNKDELKYMIDLCK